MNEFLKLVARKSRSFYCNKTWTPCVLGLVSQKQLKNYAYVLTVLLLNAEAKLPHCSSLRLMVVTICSLQGN